MEFVFLTDSKDINEEEIIFNSADYTDSENAEEEIKEDIIDAMNLLKNDPTSGNKVFLLATPIEDYSIIDFFKIVRLEAYKKDIHYLRIVVASKKTVDHLKSRFLSCDGDDPYDLQRFVHAQSINYDKALLEIKKGKKLSHWMWYIFPQYEGLGLSPTSRQFSIKSIGEAEAYLSHPVLGPRLKECAEAVLGVVGRSAHEIFGSPDDAKLRSSATLFARISPYESLFHQIIDKYFDGKQDSKTLSLMSY
jgi:uncharacterized protein (DUF1810 family)